MIKILSLIVLIILVLILSSSALYLLTKGKLFKSIYHDKFMWHIPDSDYTGYYDGCSNHSICKICGQDITQDSQGNWF